jgi:hypothetical protein
MLYRIWFGEILLKALQINLVETTYGVLLEGYVWVLLSTSYGKKETLKYSGMNKEIGRPFIN